MSCQRWFIVPMIRLVPGMLALERGLRVLGQVGPKGGLDTTLRTLAVGSKSIGLKRQADWAVQT